VVQQVEAAVVLLGKVDVGHQYQDLHDAAEVLGDGVVKGRVPVRVLANSTKGRALSLGTICSEDN
jgi:hypothetical protein